VKSFHQRDQIRVCRRRSLQFRYIDKASLAKASQAVFKALAEVKKTRKIKK